MRYLVLTIAVAASCLTACRRTPQEKSAKMIDSGKEYAAKKDYAHAIIQFRRAVQYTPADAEPYYQAGVAYLQMLDVPSAFVNFRKAVELNPRHTGAQIRLAELLSASHDPASVREAADHAREVLKLLPDDRSALNTLAITEFELGKTADAESHLKEALAQASPDDRTAVNLALMHIYKHDLRGAIEILKKAAERNPKSAEAAVVLGRMYCAVNDAANGEREFRRAAALDPKSAEPWLALAGLLTALHRDGETERIYRTISNLPDPRFRHMLGAYFWRTGKREAAIAEFARLASAGPNDRAARDRLVAAYRLAGREPDADRILKAAYERNPKDSSALLAHAASLARMGKLDEAANALRVLIADSKDAVQAHYLLSKIYAARHQQRLQQQELDEALRQNPLFLAARLDLSQSLVAMRDPAAALDALDHAPPDQRSAVPLLIARNWVLLAKGDRGELRKQIEGCLKRGRAREFLLQQSLLEIQEAHFAAARSAASEILARNPRDTRALDIIASSFAAEKHLDSALSALAAEAHKFPRDTPVQYLYSTWLSRAGRIDEARQALASARAALPDDTALTLRLAELDFAQSRFAEARDLVASVLTRDARDVRAQMLMGHIESASNHPDAAVAHYRLVAEMEPDNAEVMNNLGGLLAEQPSSIDEALRFAQRAKELAPDNPNVNDTLGWVLYRKGLYSSAINYLEPAAQKGAPLWKYHLAMAYAQTGHREKAAREYNEAHRIGPKLPEAKEAEALLARK